MPRRTVALVVTAVVAAGCGGGDTQRKRTAGAAQIAAWEDAARIFSQQFRACGSRIYPTRRFYAACMKPAFGDYQSAATAVRRACKGTQINTAVSVVTSLQHREVTMSDASLDAYLSHRRYRGPPLGVVQARAEQAIARRLAQVRRLGAAAC
jgi:hypothetical protein